MGSEATGGKPRGFWVERRFIPTPNSISPEAQAQLDARSTAAEDPVAAAASPFALSTIMAAIHDPTRWEANKQASQEATMQWLGPADAALHSTVETVTMSGVTVHIATPPVIEADDRAYLDIHGGALVIGDDWLAKHMGRVSADLHKVRSYAVDYRMPPEHPYPAALDDCITAYRELLGHYAPENIIVGGGSAGGNLAAALILRARDEGLPLPAALFLGTPQLDLTESGDSFVTNKDIDALEPLMPINLVYAAGADLAHPYLSPLFGDFSSGFPPTFLYSGTRDLFLSNAVRMHRSLRRANVPVELHIFEAMPHDSFLGSPEWKEMLQEKARFVAEHWGRHAPA